MIRPQIREVVSGVRWAPFVMETNTEGQWPRAGVLKCLSECANNPPSPSPPMYWADKNLEDELADYNGDDDNEGEFEADKQAELAQV